MGIWIITTLTLAGVIVRPRNWPEAVWAVLGALVLVAGGWISGREAMQGVAQGLDVYLFLTGMMLLSEVAREAGVFDWVAGRAVQRAAGSPERLFLDIYLVGTVVTVFLSNDATAVVLTPAVAAVARAAQVEPLPYLFICALVANAASFVLPISNPANLVLYGGGLPPLFTWLARFALPSLLSIATTYLLLKRLEASKLGSSCSTDAQAKPLSPSGRVALGALAVTALTLLGVSAAGLELGLPTCILGVLAALAVAWQTRTSPWSTVRQVSWAVLPLVAGLFVLVQALHHTGAIEALANALSAWASHSLSTAAAGAGALLAFGCNLVNNLPAGLLTRAVIEQAHPAQKVVDCLLIGVDLGPNLSVTGSLATILWLTALRREGQSVGFWRFLKLGACIMPPALLLALAGRLVMP